MANFPKVVALDTDWTIFWGSLDANCWGKGPGALPRVEDNVQQNGFWEVPSNPGIKCGMFADVPEIIGDILKNGAKLAVVARNNSQALCDRALWYWKANDGTGNYKPLIELVSFNEVHNNDKVEHFKKIQSYTHANFADMILFDDEATNNTVEMMIGVTFQVSRDQKGLTWENYRAGIDMWRRNKSIITPFLGLNLSSYPRHKFIGYSGMDIGTIKLLESGLRRNDRKEAARYGFAVYVADNPAICTPVRSTFKNGSNTLLGGQSAQTIVCKIYARDGDTWDRMNKVWVPDETTLKTDVNGTPFNVGWSQEDRDRLVASWGVQKPYVLFARHPNMDNWPQKPGTPPFPVPNRKRWNEMVVYPQIQEAQLLAIRMTDYEVNTDIRNGIHLHYEKKLKAWNITTTQENVGEIYKYGEQYEFQP
ncbi:hypothetical protein ONZ45_g11923 [Pleurotus djamor]|nr:hypothetical protein ONZ45_g11923 [Pleurotus djamor]